MAESSNPREPARFKFLEVFIPLPKEAHTFYDKLEQMKDRLTVHKSQLDQTTPLNPGYYDLYFKVIEDENDETLKLIRKFEARKEKQNIGEIIMICVLEEVRDGMTPVQEKPEDGRKYVRYQNLWYNEDFLTCYNAVMLMVNGLLEDAVRMQEAEARRRLRNPDPYRPPQEPEWDFFIKEESDDGHT
ncbi:hypothetical protein P875_00042791 [Aspergillus parasiticus SU-1]|uniref:Uncharacterized protein n=1 Tax=Aspergillus parasiticus (strain ATCC 56775 / NRRL 5862 / SRRC 143 / SU-1) TaxID=1403190 RepID=A0A0F0HZQ1_ASPPU|nr:hypothetical protein P875_00042791 [Aspergillus parasiticus SU-1]